MQGGKWGRGAQRPACAPGVALSALPPRRERLETMSCNASLASAFWVWRLGQNSPGVVAERKECSRKTPGPATPAARVLTAQAGAARSAPGAAVRTVLVAPLGQPAIVQSLALRPDVLVPGVHQPLRWEDVEAGARGGRQRNSAEMPAPGSRGLQALVSGHPQPRRMPSTW